MHTWLVGRMANQYGWWNQPWLTTPTWLTSLLTVPTITTKHVQPSYQGGEWLTGREKDDGVGQLVAGERSWPMILLAMVWLVTTVGYRDTVVETIADTIDQ